MLNVERATITHRSADGARGREWQGRPLVARITESLGSWHVKDKISPHQGRKNKSPSDLLNWALETSSMFEAVP